MRVYVIISHLCSPPRSISARFLSRSRDPRRSRGRCVLSGPPPQNSEMPGRILPSETCAQSEPARGPTITEEARPTRRPSAGSPRWLFPPLAVPGTYMWPTSTWEGGGVDAGGGGCARRQPKGISTSFILSPSCRARIRRFAGVPFRLPVLSRILFGEVSRASRFRHWARRSTFGLLSIDARASLRAVLCAFTVLL